MKTGKMSGFAGVIAALVLLAGMTGSANAGGGRERAEAAKAKGLPVFVDFGRTSCVPCKMMVPVLDELARKNKGRMEVVFVHIDEERDYALKMGVTVIPTQVLLDRNGKEVSRHVGYMPVEECEKMISKTVTVAPAKPGVSGKAGVKVDGVAAGKTCSPGSTCK